MLKKNKQSKIKVVFKESDTPKEEKERRIQQVFGMLLGDEQARPPIPVDDNTLAGKIDAKILRTAVKDGIEKLGIADLKIIVSVLDPQAKEDSKRLGEDTATEDFAEIRVWKNGYKASFDLGVINKLKLNEKQVQGLVLHELTHIFRIEAMEFGLSHQRAKPGDFEKNHKEWWRWHSSGILGRLGELEEILIDMFVVNTFRGYPTWSIPHEENGKVITDLREYLLLKINDFHQELLDEIHRIYGNE